MKKKPIHDSALADHVHEAYKKFCKKRGIPTVGVFIKKPKGSKLPALEISD